MKMLRVESRRRNIYLSLKGAYPYTFTRSTNWASMIQESKNLLEGRRILHVSGLQKATLFLYSSFTTL